MAFAFLLLTSLLINLISIVYRNIFIFAISRRTIQECYHRKLFNNTKHIIRFFCIEKLSKLTNNDIFIFLSASYCLTKPIDT